MAGVTTKPFEQPDEVRTFPFGRLEIFQFGELVLGRSLFLPGWRWSEHVRPIAGTERCQYHHVGFSVSGRLRVRMADGSEHEIRPGVAHEILPGHDAWVVGDEAWVAIDIAGMRSYARPSPEDQRVLAAVLLTDIVDSTTHLARLGDGAWQELLGRFDQAARYALDQYRGRLVKSTGDRYLALFDGAARAVHCGAAMCRAARVLGLEIRAGVHTGEVEVTEDDVRGVAVHIASRVMSAAAPGEVWVSDTTRELAVGSSLALEPRGRHALKGIDGERDLYSLVTSA